MGLLTATKISFYKYHGAANDFVLVDCIDENHFFSKHQIQTICHRKHGVGADGLIIVRFSVKAHAKMRFFNQDGSEAALCGNGLRCVASYLMQKYNVQSCLVESYSGIHKCFIYKGEIAVQIFHKVWIFIMYINTHGFIKIQIPLIT